VGSPERHERGVSSLVLPPVVSRGESLASRMGGLRLQILSSC
jgi:hypothetical protein